jgi:hypothetical protein
MAPKANKAAEAEKKRKALAQRQQEAEEAFTRADEDGSGSVDATELKRLLTGLLQREGVAFDSNIVGEFVNAEYAKADSDGSGDVDFDEFITYYNLLVDRLAGGGMKDALEQAKQRTAEKLEEQAVAEDPAVYEHLHTLAAILSNPSVQSYAGLNVPFNLKEKGTFGNLNPEHAPRSEEGASSRGLILDLSRRAQRLLTPWGSLPFGYRLSFEGYQEKLQTEEEAAAKSKSKAKKQQAATLVPAGTSATEKFSMFLTLCVPGASTLLQLRRIPLRCHFQVTAIDGKPLPCGEVIGVTGDAAKAKLSTRFMNLIKAYPKDPVPPLPPDDGDKGPLINVLMGETVAVRPDRLDNLKKRKEVSGRTGNKRFPEEDLALSMIICHNADADAAKLLVKMQGSENNVLDRRKGHATREMVRYALHTCGSEYDQTHLDHAEWMLKNQVRPTAAVARCSSACARATLPDAPIRRTRLSVVLVAGGCGWWLWLVPVAGGGGCGRTSCSRMGPTRSPGSVASRPGSGCRLGRRSRRCSCSSAATRGLSLLTSNGNGAFVSRR